MTEHKRNIWVTDCLEANVYYNMRMGFINSLLAEVYLMRSETIVNS